MKADPNIKCDRRNWGTFADRRTIRIFKRHHNKQLRYIGRREILLDQER